MKITPARARWIGRLGTLLLRTLGWTWRVRMHGHHMDFGSSDLLVAFLHGDMLLPAYTWRRTPGAIMVSEHGDGELIAQVVQRIGDHVPVRGSSTRGGARAFLEIIREKGEIGWAITPDGPRGPRGRVHDGVIQLASEGGRPITPAAFESSPAWRLRSWDRFMIPKPFARAVGYVGEPLVVPPDLDREHRKSLAAELEQRLADCYEQASHALANW